VCPTHPWLNRLDGMTGDLSNTARDGRQTGVGVGSSSALQARIDDLMGRLSLEEKIGQMELGQPGAGSPVESLGDAIRSGRIGSVVNLVDRESVVELQRIAVEESPHGIPLLFGRDVIHGFETILPIPLGQAASWNPALVRDGARMAAKEAARSGVNWTFAPMIDIARDPRWGRIAESPGEDVFLACRLTEAMVEGFQGDALSDPDAIAACAKHFAGYGASESGRDYATTNIPDHELHNVYLPPFKAAVERGVATLMTSFSDLDGIPATAHKGLLRDLLRDQWSFEGVVVSDWESIPQLSVHGLTADDEGSALAAVRAGVDLEMASETYAHHLADAVRSGVVPLDLVDSAVSRVLRMKFELGLFENPYAPPDDDRQALSEEALRMAYQAALESMVLLQNRNEVLPLDRSRLRKLAVIGPMADAPYEQLGTWVFDGDVARSISALEGVRAAVGQDAVVVHSPALETSRSRDFIDIEQTLDAAREADAVVLFLGEESILSGEAHSRADIDLPGAQVDLVRRVQACGRPVIAVILAGRPLTLANIIDQVDGILYAWHPGCMGGPAIADLLFGVESPSGKLPVTFPRAVGQIPLYYNARNTGKPPTPDTVVHMDQFPVEAPQTSLGMSAFHMDVHPTPQFSFGFGLSYAEFRYANLRLDREQYRPGDTVRLSVDLSNTGQRPGIEVVQLYIRDPVASITRPVRELKGFQRVRVEPGQTVRVEFRLSTDELRFYHRLRGWLLEPGQFHVWVGGNSDAELGGVFELIAN